MYAEITTKTRVHGPFWYETESLLETAIAPPKFTAKEQEADENKVYPKFEQYITALTKPASS